MKRTYRILATTTALTVFATMGMANNNEAYLEQDGNNNTAMIEQDAGPGNNRVGTASKPALQDGNDNTLEELQFTGGGFSNGNNVIDFIRQLGNSNFFRSKYSNNAGNNLIDEAKQDGNDNVAKVTRNASIGGKIWKLIQDGNINVLSLTQQAGNNNVVTLAKMDGNNNGFGSGVNRYNHGIYIVQDGNNNQIAEASITGNNNTANHPSSSPLVAHYYWPSPPVTLGDPVRGYAALDIDQDGNNNYAKAVMQGKDGNQLVIDQDGNQNDSTVLMGKANGHTQNATLVLQLGNNNTGNVEIDGSHNGSGVYTPGSDADSVGLTSGVVDQIGDGNVFDVDIMGNHNQFAGHQTGNNNDIDAEVTGNFNEFAVSQIGNGHTADVVQNGNGNNAGITQ